MGFHPASVIILLFWNAGCAPSAIEEPAATLTPTISPTEVLTPVVEHWAVELEWPAAVYLGDSDTIRLTLHPSEVGYLLEAEFEEHATQTTEIEITRQAGYLLYATASLDAVGFHVSPEKPVSREVPFGKTVSWQWNITPSSSGKQRVVISMSVLWRPEAGAAITREFATYTNAVEIRVLSFLGATKTQALGVSFLGLLIGSGMSLAAFRRRFAAHRRPERREKDMVVRTANPHVRLETRAGIVLPPEEQNLLKALFYEHGRLVIEQEYHSGYSGARTLMTLPIRKDGRSDAETIVKIADRRVIQREYSNYLNFVKHSLPAVTARIEEPPISTGKNDKVCLMYTFVGKPGSPPLSLRQALMEQETPAYLNLLFDTFGPKWWMQHRAETFRMDREYDRRLPPHYFIEPCDGQGASLEGNKPAGVTHYQTGDLVRVLHISEIEPRSGARFSLGGKAIHRKRRPAAALVGEEIPKRDDRSDREHAQPIFGESSRRFPQSVRNRPNFHPAGRARRDPLSHPLHHPWRLEPGKHPCRTRATGMANRFCRDTRGAHSV